MCLTYVYTAEVLKNIICIKNQNMCRVLYRIFFLGGLGRRATRLFDHTHFSETTPKKKKKAAYFV